MPAHADWLNDLSSMVPSSATMQPVNLAVDAALDAGAAALEAAVAAGLEADEAGVVLLPHAVASNAAAAHAATDNAVIRTGTSTGLGSPQCTTGAPLVRRELRPLEPARCEIAIHDRKYPVKFLRSLDRPGNSKSSYRTDRRSAWEPNAHRAPATRPDND
jgi:hypothetical protein